MRTISKATEPKELTAHRSKPGAVYDHRGIKCLPIAQQSSPTILASDTKQILRVALVKEQFGLCCYCGGRIVPSESEMRIEHWEPLTQRPDRQLDYSNLLGACTGNESSPGSGLHCDAHKGDDDLSRNPAEPAHRVEDFVEYLANGTVSAPKDQTFHRELGGTVGGKKQAGVLNLNHPLLIANRKAVLSSFQESLGQFGGLSRSQLERLLTQWSTGCSLPAFAPVVAFWIRKRLKRP